MNPMERIQKALYGAWDESVWALVPVVLELMAEAWEEGAVVGDDPWGVPDASNPYREKKPLTPLPGRRTTS